MIHPPKTMRNYEFPEDDFQILLILITHIHLVFHVNQRKDC